MHNHDDQNGGCVLLRQCSKVLLNVRPYIHGQQTYKTVMEMLDAFITFLHINLEQSLISRLQYEYLQFLF